MALIELLQKRSAQNHPLIQVILGPRQVGKTTAAAELFDKWTGSKLMVSADLPGNQNSEFMVTNWLRARALTEPCLFIIDEVQKIENWADVAKALFEEDRNKRDIRIFFLGSASLSVQAGLSESLAGRFEIIRANHWNLDQMKKDFGWNIETYLKFGGYPGAVQFVDEPLRWQSYVRDSIVEPVLSRDLGQIANVSKPALFRQLFTLAMDYPAQVVSYQKLVGTVTGERNTANN